MRMEHKFKRKLPASNVKILVTCLTFERGIIFLKNCVNGIIE